MECSYFYIDESEKFYRSLMEGREKPAVESDFTKFNDVCMELIEENVQKGQINFDKVSIFFV